MEISKSEVLAVAGAIEVVRIDAVRELEALELALIGGGCGDVQF